MPVLGTAVMYINTGTGDAKPAIPHGRNDTHATSSTSWIPGGMTVPGCSIHVGNAASGSDPTHVVGEVPA